MSTNAEEGDTTILSPDEAFATLGNETRMAILQALGEADEPRSFSELREKVGMSDSGQFNYHLDQLTGHYIRKTDDGYELLQAGRRVIEAVLSGTVTEVPDFESTQIDTSCPECGAPTEVRYDATEPRPVRHYCTQCAGFADWFEPADHGALGTYPLPPAGLHGRTPQEVQEAGSAWEHLEYLSAVIDLCPRCSAPVEHSITACESHDPIDGVCDNCNRRYAAQLSSGCPNCLFDLEDQFAATIALRSVEMLAFLTTHGINPITDPIWASVISPAEEQILSTDPFEARFTFTLDDDTLTLTVDEDLSVAATERDDG